jgi:hypothetical protein
MRVNGKNLFFTKKIPEGYIKNQNYFKNQNPDLWSGSFFRIFWNPTREYLEEIYWPNKQKNHQPGFVPASRHKGGGGDSGAANGHLPQTMLILWSN